MNRIVGIDLGTTHSLVASVDAGIPYVIAESHGRRLVPSVVQFPGDGGEPIVGDAAQRMRVVKPAETVYGVKRFMGRRANEMDPDERLVRYPIQGDGAGPVTFPIHGRSRRPEDVSAEILKYLKTVAEAALEEPVSRAVITVPAYFNDAQRNATKLAGELAGFTVERIINEPTAAALAYGLDRLKDRSRIAVYDFGGGTFDLSILELNQGVFQVLATHGNTRLGGTDIDHALLVQIQEWVREENGPDCSEDPVRLARIQEAAEAAKIRLSTEPAVEIVLPFLDADFNFRRTVTRDELESIARDTVLRTRSHCIQALADAKLRAEDLDQVILVGGQTRMPLVRQLAAEFFGCPEFEEERGGLRIGTDFHRREGPALNTGQNPDEAVALGAAIQAEILMGGFRNVLLLDVTPLSLGLETFGGLMNVIIPRNSTIPVKAGEKFTTAVDFQKDMLIHVLQGERERARDNWSLGRFSIDFDPAPRGVARVGVQFEIDANGILHVLARDLASGREERVDMKSAVDVDDDKVQEMVEESVEHAFDDLAARRWIEAKLRAEQTLEAARRGLDQYGAEIPESAGTAIREAIGRLEALIGSVSDSESESDDPNSTVGDPAALKAAHADLDKASKPLADLMMDRIMEAMLEKRGLI